METIKYNDKEYKMPFDADYNRQKADSFKEEIIVNNRFSNESALLPWFAVAVYDAILGAEANITSLISSGMDPHNFSMKPSHAAALSQADLVVFIGASLTPSLAEKLSSLAAGTKIIELEDIPNVHLILVNYQEVEIAVIITIVVIIAVVLD